MKSPNQWIKTSGVFTAVMGLSSLRGNKNHTRSPRVLLLICCPGEIHHRPNDRLMWRRKRKKERKRTDLLPVTERRYLTWTVTGQSWPVVGTVGKPFQFIQSQNRSWLSSQSSINGKRSFFKTLQPITWFPVEKPSGLLHTPCFPSTSQLSRRDDPKAFCSLDLKPHTFLLGHRHKHRVDYTAFYYVWRGHTPTPSPDPLVAMQHL